MADSDSAYVAWIAASAVFFNSLVSVGIMWLTKRSDERKHRRQVAFTLAIEHHKLEYERAKFAVQGTPGLTVVIESLDMAIIHAAALCDMLDSTPSKNNVGRELAAVHEIISAARIQAEKYSRELKERPRPS